MVLLGLSGSRGLAGVMQGGKMREKRDCADFPIGAFFGEAPRNSAFSRAGIPPLIHSTAVVATLSASPDNDYLD